MNKNFNIKPIAVVLSIMVILVSNLKSVAQISLQGQLRTRTEVRDGLGNLVKNGEKSAAFTSQRTRLNFGYKWDRLLFGIAVQDVRVWGQDASSISNADGSKFMLHEGWAEVTLANKADTTVKFKLLDLLSLKIGRQELAYDDARLIGNLDWLQQARRHDMVLLKTVHKGWQVDLGLAFNQNNDNFNNTGTGYLPANINPTVWNSNGVLVPTPAGMIPLINANNKNYSAKPGAGVGLAFANPPSTNGATQDYKSFKTLYVSKKFKQTKLSALFFQDDFSAYKLDSVGTDATGKVYGRRYISAGLTDTYDYNQARSRSTYGLMLNHTLGNASSFGKVAIQAAYYAQKGDDREGNKMDAYHWTASATYQKDKYSLTLGYDVLSGNDGASALNNYKASSGKNQRFDPLYGTPHKHWGYMDYFYVGTNSPAGGLNNGYLKLKYTGNTLTIGADVHTFALNQATVKSGTTLLDKNLGTEIDFAVNYNMNKFTNLELGYSIMKATESMAYAKGQVNATNPETAFNRSGSWLYLMVNIKPDFFYTKPVAIK
ncbi:MAG: alginate export family protein [Pseudarcicella sp.]|nr:alginate export family protein [Pseudarcicella sp.]MBP6410658.1 alginate export family protein [Pseudarcicella sp.]